MTNKLTLDDYEQLCADVINEFAFKNIWNEVGLEYRAHIKPLSLFDGASKVGAAPMFDRSLQLPSKSDPYFIWTIDASDLPLKFDIPKQSWTTAEDICNKSGILFDMHTMTGKMLHKRFIYLRYNSIESILVVAVLKKMFVRCASITDVKNTLVCVYADSDIPDPVNVLSVSLPVGTTSHVLNITRKSVEEFVGTTTNPDHIIVYRNGVAMNNGFNVPDITIGDFFDIIVDQNIKFVVTMDITDNSENPVFLSDRDSIHKQLLHIPKHLNQENRIITHNTCDVFVFKHDSVLAEGLYLHRYSPRTVDQVTHNDFSVPLFVLDAYRDYLNTQNITLKMVVRTHSKNKKLLRDSSYIDLLYSDFHSDDDIIKILVGRGPEQIPWWKASELEKSLYVTMMFDTPNYVTVENMKDFVEALGFYQVISLLCQRVVTATITDGFSGYYTYTKPYLYYNRDVVPIIYLNGKKIRKEYIKYANNPDNTVIVTFDPRLVCPVGSKLTAVFYLHGRNDPFVFVPSDMNRSITIPYSDFDIYVRRDRVTTDPSGVDIVYRDWYLNITQELTAYSVDRHDDGTATISVAARYQDREIIIQNAFCTNELVFDIDDYVSTGETLSIPLTAYVPGTENRRVPLLNIRNSSVYLNGKYLVRGVDYTINKLSGKDGAIASSELVIQTLEYFVDTGNVVEVIANSAEVEDSSFGFSIDDKLSDETPINLYFKNLSLVHLGGDLLRNIDFRGTHIALPPGAIKNGTLFEVQTAVPGIIKDFVLRYHTNIDKDRLRILNEYFYGHIHIVPDFMVLEQQYRIYSTFLNTLIFDIVSGKKKLINDPDVKRFADQIKEYLPIKDADLVFKNLDKRFVDFYPTHFNAVIPVQVKEILDRLVEIYMPEDKASEAEVVYGE